MRVLCRQPSRWTFTGVAFLFCLEDTVSQQASWYSGSYKLCIMIFVFGLRTRVFIIDVQIEAGHHIDTYSLYLAHCDFCNNLSAAKEISSFDERWELYFSVDVKLGIYHKVRNYIDLENVSSRFKYRVCGLTCHGLITKFSVPDMKFLLLSMH